MLCVVFVACLCGVYVVFISVYVAFVMCVCDVCLYVCDVICFVSQNNFDKPPDCHGPQRKKTQ